jgi:hypothetical protein
MELEARSTSLNRSKVLISLFSNFEFIKFNRPVFNEAEEPVRTVFPVFMKTGRLAGGFVNMDKCSLAGTR